MAWTTPETFTAGQTLTAASMNVISGNLNALPRGYVIHAIRTTAQTGITSIVDVTSLTVSVTQEANRRYLVRVHSEMGSTTAGDVVGLYLTDGSNNVLSRAQISASAANTGYIASMTYYEATTAAGTVTRKVRATRLSGSGNAFVDAATTAPSLIVVEDIGPA